MPKLEWNESEHPRDDDGKFTNGADSQTSDSQTSGSQTNEPNMKKTVLLGADVEVGEMRKETSLVPKEDLTDSGKNDKVKEGCLAKATDLLNPETDPNIKQRLTEYIADLNAEEGISNDMTELAENIGTELLGFEFRIKNANSARFMEKLRKNPTKRNGDNVRYTVKLDDDSVAVYHKTVEELKSRGYTQISVHNYWEETGNYKGINTKWRSANGSVFEVQYHSKTNLAIKEQLHKFYEIQRSSSKSVVERDEAEKAQKKISAKFRRPIGVENIKNLEVE